MARYLTALFCVILLSLPASSIGEEADNAATGNGFICRTISDGSVAVVSPLTGAFTPGSRIRFFDDTGQVCGTGTVKSAYSDLAYVAVDNCSPDTLKKGFIASAGEGDNEARMLCGFSMNLPMLLEKGGGEAHAVPPNVLRIKYNDNATKPVWFRHYKHDMACVKCHHRGLDTPCKACHPTKKGKDQKAGGCIKEICTGCHIEHKDKTSECGWCHKDTPPGAPGGR
jgi:hypothetical protein